MQKIMFCLIGNLATGKSTTIERLSEELPTYRVIAVDSYRERYNPLNTIHSEPIVYEQIMKDVLIFDHIILEMSGTAKLYPDLISAFKNKGGLVYQMALDASHGVLIERIKLRSSVAFPYKNTVERTLKFMTDSLRRMSVDIAVNVGNHQDKEYIYRLIKSQSIYGLMKKNQPEGSSNFIAPVEEKIPKGHIALERALRLLMRGQNTDSFGFFKITMFKKDGTEKVIEKATKYSKHVSINETTGRVTNKMGGHFFENKIITNDDHIFLKDHVENKIIRLNLDMWHKIDGLVVYH
jgi:hypothetical protein